LVDAALVTREVAWGCCTRRGHGGRGNDAPICALISRSSSSLSAFFMPDEGLARPYQGLLINRPCPSEYLSQDAGCRIVICDSLQVRAIYQ
jgi:hypothetical protein